MSKARGKTRVFCQPYEPATPDASVRVVVLGGAVAGTYRLAQFVNYIDGHRNILTD